MKHLLLLFLLLSSYATSVAQIVVSDPAATKIASTGWTKSLAEAAAQSKTLIENKKLLTQSVEVFTKISSTLQNVNTIKNIIDRQVKMVNMVNKELTRKDVKNLDLYRKKVETLQNILVEAQSTISLLNSVMSPTIQMSQGERLKIIVDLDKQSQEQYELLRQKAKLYETLERSLRVLEPIKSKKK